MCVCASATGKTFEDLMRFECVTTNVVICLLLAPTTRYKKVHDIAVNNNRIANRMTAFIKSKISYYGDKLCVNDGFSANAFDVYVFAH